MREYREYLSEREIFIIENHPQMTYKKIGDELGITQERVRQLKVHAERMIREEHRREQAKENGKLPVQLTIQRRDVYIIIEALREYRSILANKIKDPKDRKKPDHEKIDLWRQRLEEIEKMLNDGYLAEPFLSVITTYGGSDKKE